MVPQLSAVPPWAEPPDSPLHSLGLPDFRGITFLVVGDVMLDRYLYGDVERISPEAPVPVVRVSGLEERPGGAANVALNLSALGAEVILLGAAGEDDEARHLVELLGASRVQCPWVTSAALQTTLKTRVLSNSQQLLRIDREQHLNENYLKKLQERFVALLPLCNAVIFSDYAKGVLGKVAEWIALAKMCHLPIFVDPKGQDFSRYAGVDVLTPNQGEFNAVAGVSGDEAEFFAKGEKLLQELELSALLVTRGSLGMTLFSVSGVEHFPAETQEVYDVTGAGDTVISVLAATHVAGCSLKAAAKFANQAAAVAVRKIGVTVVRNRDLLDGAGDFPSFPAILSSVELPRVLRASRALGERLVMTNGCFDLLHVGHVEYLRQAAGLGDRLLVAINDDDSVGRLKGARRPLVPLESRMQVLAGLASVDWVVPFSELTPERLIGDVMPDVLVKGGDYRVDEVVGAKLVQENGGEVKIIDYIKGFSTSDMLAKARR